MYILRCSNGQYYVGSTQDLDKRLAEHQCGEGALFTKKHLPVELVYYEQFQRIVVAFQREHQIKGWNRKKKEALINNRPELLPELSKHKVFYLCFGPSTGSGTLVFATMNILVTGGAGFIGSHTLVELNAAGHETVVIDNLSNSNPKSLERVAELTGKAIPFYKVDIRDRVGLNHVMEAHHFDACIHFAGLKAVGESVEKPWEYYENNISGTLTLLDVMRQHGCKNIIFSSSATVYGDPAIIPITEECPKGHCTNPYGQTKSMLEEIMMDMQKADKEWNIVLLRYFNPIGAHPSGRIGENPNGIPNNLMPYVTQVAVGKRPELGVFGNDYDTPDGTGVRDYIHVVDLARGHVAALQAIERNCGCAIYNLGTGQGYSVLQVVNTFEKVNGIKIPYSIKPRRAGDIATCYSNPAKAEKELGWKAQYGLEEMCRDSWNWQKNNPNGF